MGAHLLKRVATDINEPHEPTKAKPSNDSERWDGFSSSIELNRI